MMSRISGNQTNNSEQPNASVSGVSATATDLASAAALNKQRKRRKKKKDKTSATNEAVNCSCGKRIESSCNSVSTFSNCVPSACVYCHFNELAYRENCLAKQPLPPPPSPPLHRFQGDLYDLNITHCSAINFWPQKIESTQTDVIGKETSNIDNSTHFMRQQRNNALNRRTEQLQRFAIYENLCEFCGFALGNGAYHSHCANEHTTDRNQHTPDNIYENICESCHSLFDGEQCTSETCKRNNSAVLESVPITGEVIDVLVKKPPITNRQFGKQFSEFLGSFKQKLTSKTSDTERKKPKIEIIHNTNDVFKTNKTFDLNEIVQLRNESLLNKGAENTCSELITSSDEIVTELLSKPIRVFRASNSDSNFLENYHLSSSPHLQSPFSDSIVSDTILYSNSYAPPSYEDAIQHSKYASVCPFKLRAGIKPRVYDDSTSASSFFTYNSSSVSTLRSHSLAGERKSPIVPLLFSCDDAALQQWLTLLRHTTDEYADDYRQFECESTKCLPSKMLNESASKLKWSIEHANNMNAANTESDTKTNLLHRIELFKENLMEHKMHSKRNAIYIKDSVCDVSMDATLSPDTTVAPDIETAGGQPSSLPSPHCPRIGSDSAENSDDIVCLRSKCRLTPFTEENRASHELHINHNVALELTSQYLQMLKTFYMAQVTLSTSLNRITLVCGDRRVHFFFKFLVSQPQSVLHSTNTLVKPTKYTNIQHIIELIQKTSVIKQLGVCDKSNQTNRIDRGRKGRPEEENAFLMRSTNLVLRTPLRIRHKRSIDDFAKRKQRIFGCSSTEIVKTFDDFSKPGANDNNKSFNDFTVKKTDYSSSAATGESNNNNENNMQNLERSEVTQNDSQKASEENIYQPIWMFKTIGTAADEDSLNPFDTCENESVATTAHDGSEWELAEQDFLFSNQRLTSAEHLNIMHPISHDTDAEPPLSHPDTYDVQTLTKPRFYQTICVLYNPKDPKLNEIIYDYNGNSTKKSANLEHHETENECKRMNMQNNSKQIVGIQSQKMYKDENVSIELDSVRAWKAMLRTVDYIDDEEDVILSESYLLNQKSAEYNNQNNDNLQSAESIESVCESTKTSSPSDKTDETDLSSDLSINSSVASNSPTATIESKSKKESGFLNKLQYRRFDISKNSAKKEDVVQGLFYKNLNGKMHSEPSPPMEIKRLNQTSTGTVVFGTTLDEVEKDDKKTDIPKFVVECIKVIEIEENLQTNGIYRASGKKESIDKLRKKMNESKLRKGTKYVSLKDEDVHTITGALKQFFRELKTELIPENIVKNLPNDLESEASIVSIRNGISTIDYLSRETLKYVLQHLVRVDANKEHNLMNASNLGIVWGASLFTSSSVNITNAFETSDILRRNTLIKILIQRYDDIFIDTDRLI